MYRMHISFLEKNFDSPFQVGFIMGLRLELGQYPQVVRQFWNCSDFVIGYELLCFRHDRLIIDCKPQQRLQYS